MRELLQDSRRRKPFKTLRRNSLRPALEGLEDRLLLFATNGGLWTYPVRVTYSFVPDGTSIGGVSSNMFATLNAVESTATWQAAIEQAASIWESAANINLALVSDDGTPMGRSGDQQDDPGFGDIRVSMIPQSTGVLAFTTLPPPINGGTAAGDITLNSNINWSSRTGYDLETVALHEFGHALGLDHSSLMSAVMYAYYSGVNQNLTSDDISGIQSVYGPIPSPAGSNHTISTAWNLTPNINTTTDQLSLGGQSILNNDADYWYVTVPAGAGSTMWVSTQTNDLSSLSPTIGVYNSSKVPLIANSAPWSYGATTTVGIANVVPGQGYYIRCGSTYGGTGSGAYGLLVNFTSNWQPPISPPNTVVASQANQGGGSSNDTAGPVITSSGDQDGDSNGNGNANGHGNGNANGNGNGNGNANGHGSEDSPVQVGNLLLYIDELKTSDLKGTPVVHFAPQGLATVGGPRVYSLPSAARSTSEFSVSAPTQASSVAQAPEVAASFFTTAKEFWSTRFWRRPGA